MADGVAGKALPSIRRGDNLALLYQGVLTTVVRVQSGRQPITDAAAFRKRIQDVLPEVEREAVRAGYAREDVSKTNYAVTAFLDEAILNSDDPNRSHWSYLGEALSGERFFENIQEFLRQEDSTWLADVLEVHYLCLLLGYRGRYAGGSPEGLHRLMDELQRRIERVRGRHDQLSPAALLPQEPQVRPEPVPSPWGALKVALMAVGLVALVWLLFWALLNSQAADLTRTLQSSL